MAWMQFINVATFHSAPSLVLTFSWRQATEVGFSSCGIPSGLPRTYVICLGQHEAWSKARCCAAWVKDHVKPSNLPKWHRPSIPAVQEAQALAQANQIDPRRMWPGANCGSTKRKEFAPQLDQWCQSDLSPDQHCPRHGHPQCSAQRC